MRQNQKGFTLVELIVVMAIMALLISGSIISYSLVVGQNIKGCTADVQSYIARTRVEALSKQDIKLTLSTTDYGVYAKLSTENRDVKIGRPAISISYTTDKGNTVELSGTQKLVLSFDRSTGAFKPLEGTPSTEYCTSIVLTSGSRTMTIKLIPKTGKYYLE